MDLYPGLESRREERQIPNTYVLLVPSSLPEERLFSPLLDDGSHLLQKQETMRKSVLGCWNQEISCQDGLDSWKKNARNSSRCKHVKYQKVISKLIKNQFTQAALYVLQTATLLNLDDVSSRTPRTWFAYFCNPSYVFSSFVFLIKMICIRSALQQIGKPSFRAFPVSRMSAGKLVQFNVLGFLRKLKLFLDFSSWVLKLYVEIIVSLFWL